MRTVKFRVNKGPAWEIGHHYDDEVLEFDVMKMANERGKDHDVLQGVFAKPIKLRVQVDYIASPLHAREQMICGKIVGIPEQGVMWAGIPDIFGMMYLREGDSVRVIYEPISRTGHVVFGESDWLRMHVHDGALDFLMTNEYLNRFHRMMEVVQYATLNQPSMDIGKIQFVRNIAQWARVNERDPEIVKRFSYDTVVKDSLLADIEHPIILC